MCLYAEILACILKTESIILILISSLVFYYTQRISRLQNKLVSYEDDFFVKFFMYLIFLCIPKIYEIFDEFNKDDII